MLTSFYACVHVVCIKTCSPVLFLPRCVTPPIKITCTIQRIRIRFYSYVFLSIHHRIGFIISMFVYKYEHLCEFKARHDVKLYLYRQSISIGLSLNIAVRMLFIRIHIYMNWNAQNCFAACVFYGFFPWQRNLL